MHGHVWTISEFVWTFGFAPQAIASGDVKIDFKGVALGDSWISPIGEANFMKCFVRDCS